MDVKKQNLHNIWYHDTMISKDHLSGDTMVDAVLDIAQQQTALDSPRKRFSEALKASRQLQSDGRTLGHDRVDRYYENVEGDWLECWQEGK
jgi:hypothetical protein